MRTYAEYKEMYPDKTDAQIIELLDWELGEKVQEIGRLLLELNANKDGWVRVEDHEKEIQKLARYAYPGFTEEGINNYLKQYKESQQS